MIPAEQPDPASSISRRGLLIAGATAASAVPISVAAASTASAAGPVMDADAIVVGHGLAGLVATAELVAAGRTVLLLDQEPEASLGGQAFWSFGGLFFVNSDEQRLNGIKDTLDLARQDWAGTAGFDRGVNDPRGEDYWGSRWADAYLNFAAGEKRSWLYGLGMRWVPIVGWAERGGQLADGPGNSVPRFHVTMGTGPGVVEPFEKKVRDGVARKLVTFRFRHRVDALTVSGGVVDGVRGAVLEPSSAKRGTKSSRVQVGTFELHAPVVIVTSGGIGGNPDLVRQNWPARLGPAPARMITGVPDHVDGRMLAITAQAGGRLVNQDRMWHYTEGLKNYAPIWTNHGIRILPGRPRCGSTPAASGFRRPACPATTRSAPSSRSWTPASTTPGSCSPRRSSTRSSPSRARSRIRN